MTAAAQLAIRWLEDHSSFEDECTPRTSQAIRTLIEEVKRGEDDAGPDSAAEELRGPTIAELKSSERFGSKPVFIPMQRSDR